MTVNHIEMPARFVEVASRWYGGQGDLLYAVCSSNGLRTGTNCPIYDYTDREDRDRKWYLTLWMQLSCDVGYAVCAARKAFDQATARYEDLDDCTEDEVAERCADYEEFAADSFNLEEFEDWIDNTVLPQLQSEYPSLADWSGE